MSSQGAISSLAYSSGAVVTAASMGYVFGRPTKSKKHRKSPQLSTDSGSSMDISDDISTPPVSTTSTTSTTSSSTITNVSPKSPLKRFKLFRSKNKRSKLTSTTYILPPKTVPLMVRPEQLADDDVSSMYSDATSVYTTNVYTTHDRDRKTLSVPNLPAILQQAQHWDNSPSMSLTSNQFVPRSVTTETLHEENEEEEDWDGDSGFNEPLSKTARISSPSLPIPISTPPKRHSRCKSLPPTNVKDFSPSLYHRQPTPSENWDEDFDLGGDNELSVPSLVEESQVSLRMDISNIRDFVYHIGELKDLVYEKDRFTAVIKSKTTRKWTNGFLCTTSKKVKELENKYRQHWEEAAVIIDIADVAEDNGETFGGEKRVEVDIERIPSERHLKIFKKIVIEGLGEDAKDLVLFDDDKENHYSIPSKNTAKKQKLMPFCIKNNDEKRRRRKENFRMSVEVMPSLIDRLKKLQSRLDDHVKELEKLSAHGI